MVFLREANIADARKEWSFICNCPENENGFTNEYSGVSFDEFNEKCLPKMIANSNGEQLREGYVPDTSYFLWNENEIVGLFRLRHYLNETLRNGAGHIGYTVCKEYRGKGYASEGLSLLIPIAEKIVPEKELYLRLHRDNAASLQVQLKNGARIHHTDEECIFTRILLNRPVSVLENLRPAVTDESEQVMKLYRSAIGTYGCAWDYGYPSVENVKNDISAGTLFVIPSSEGIIGAASLSAERELDDLSFWTEQKACELARVVVRLDLRGLGIGHRILEKVLEKAVQFGYSSVRLLASEGNTAACSMYHRAGFEVRGKTERFGGHYIAFEKRIGI